MNDRQLGIAVIICVGFLCFGIGWFGGAKNATPKEHPPAQPSQWIGRLSAGDGKGNIFSAPNVEIGLRADGVMTWRMHAPEPISLVTTQAEAKK